MLDNSLREQVRTIFAPLEANYVFEATVSPEHASKGELAELLEETAACSPKISCRFRDGEGLEVRLLKDGEDTGVRFRAVPGGHEYSSLLLAVMNADGKGKNLPDPSVVRRVRALHGPALVRTYMSLSCTNCPDVVQALNLMALLNPSLTHEAVDGALFPEEAESRKVQAVPSVFLGDELIHVGRGDFARLLDKLEERLGSDEAGEAEPIDRTYDVIVAGGGPAGAAAAIYSARKGLRVAVVAGRIGGQVNETVGIENLISVPETTGAKLAADLRRHLEAYPVDLCDNRQIERFSIEGNMKVLEVKGGERFLAPAIIVATGASWRKLNVPGEADYIGRGVAFCPHCDGPFYKGKHVAVVGGGNSGLEAAIDLAGICSKVTVLEFMDTLKADSVLQEKARSLPNVEIFTSRQTTAVVGDGTRLTGLDVKNRETGEETHLALDGVFVQIGLSANSALFKDLLPTTRIGEIITDRNGRTEIPGVYAAGDVSDTTYKQIIIAMGEGAKAALAAFDDHIRGVC